MKHSGQLIVEEKIYEARKARLVEFIQGKVPPQLIAESAEHLLTSFKPSLGRTWISWRNSHLPFWLIKLFSREARETEKALYNTETQ